MSNGEYCIDVVQEWVQNQGYLTTSYVYRGDPAAPDFNQTNFTRDFFFHTLSLASIVPAGASAVELVASVMGNGVGLFFEFRRKGQTNTANICIQRTQVAMVTNYIPSVIVPLDANRDIEYALSATVLTCTCTVKGWWL